MGGEKNVTNGGWKLDNSYTELPDKFYSKIKPAKVARPRLVIFNDALASDLGLNASLLRGDIGSGIFSGNISPQGSIPIAQAYAGHQFGHFTMLGDGRAILLGEQNTPSDEKFDIQLKGSGRTPYSRGGDGKATLGPMLREYIISEAMNGLGIPTTRSLAVVSTGEEIRRESQLPGAILSRVASSHIRVGTFQFAANWASSEELRELADYTIRRHFTKVLEGDNPYLSMLADVIRRQAALIAKWQLVGFVHGVMNTDNMTLSGETIDYGPCAFMDAYDSKTVFSSIDHGGRYAYGNQPVIGQWNLARLAETLLPLLRDNENDAIKIAQDRIEDYVNIYQDYWLKGMRAKLGIFNEELEDEEIIDELLKMMEVHKSDYTNTFLALTFDRFQGEDLFATKEFQGWHSRWSARLERQKETEEASHTLMQASNPAVIPRNHQVEKALDRAVADGDYSLVKKLLGMLANPYDHRLDRSDYVKPPHPSCPPYRTFCGT